MSIFISPYGARKNHGRCPVHCSMRRSVISISCTILKCDNCLKCTWPNVCDPMMCPSFCILRRSGQLFTLTPTTKKEALMLFSSSVSNRIGVVVLFGPSSNDMTSSCSCNVPLTNNVNNKQSIHYAKIVRPYAVTPLSSSAWSHACTAGDLRLKMRGRLRLR